MSNKINLQVARIIAFYQCLNNNNNNKRGKITCFWTRKDSELVNNEK